MRAARPLAALALLLFAAAGANVSGCSPAHRDAVREAVPPLTRAVCVLLHAFTSSGAVEEVCATAEELAPFVSEILAQRAAKESDGAATKAPGTVSLAFSLPAPARPVPRRRCVSWIDLRASDGGSEGGADASP